MATPNIMTGDAINTLAGVQQENLISGSLTVEGAVDVGSLTVNGVPVSGTPGGATTEVQVNVAGAFGAFDNLTYDNDLDGNGPGLTIGKTAQASNNVSLNMIDNNNKMSHTWDGTAYSLAIPNGNATGNITISAAQNVGLNTLDCTLTVHTEVSISNGNLRLTTAGKGYRVTEGSNCKQGVATLVAGTIVVSNTSVTANSRIFLTSQDPNGGTVGFLTVSARTASTSFTILSSDVADTSIVAYEIFEPT